MQSTATKCTTANLKALVGAFSGVKAAFCSDTHLVIISDGSPSWTPNLDDTPNPPGSFTLDAAKTACVTRTATLNPTYFTVGPGEMSPTVGPSPDVTPAGGLRSVAIGPLLSAPPIPVQFKIPLTYTLLSTATAQNNLANYPDGAADSEGGYMSTVRATYGMPTRGDVGISVSGQGG